MLLSWGWAPSIGQVSSNFNNKTKPYHSIILTPQFHSSVNLCVLFFLSLSHTQTHSFSLSATMDRVIGGKFKTGRKIGSGSFGEIYIGHHHHVSFFLLFVFIFLNWIEYVGIIWEASFVAVSYIYIYMCVCMHMLIIASVFFSASNMDTSEIVAIKMVSLLLLFLGFSLLII